jgi:hypothetical protein
MVVRKIDQENDGRLNHGFFKVVMHIAYTTFLADRHFYCEMCLSGAIPYIISNSSAEPDLIPDYEISGVHFHFWHWAGATSIRI